MTWAGSAAAWFTRRLAGLPGSHWLPTQVARLPVSIYVKLLAAFLGIVVLLVALGAVGLGALYGADQRAADLVRLERRIAAYRQLQHNTSGQLFTVASAFLASDRRELDTALRGLQRYAYDFDRATFVSRDDAELLRGIEADYSELIRIGTEVVGLVKSEELAAARSRYQERSLPLANRLERHTYALVNKAKADMVEAAVVSGEAYRTSRLVVMAAAVGTILLALVLGYSISTSLIDPIRRIRSRLRNIARGEFAGDLEVPNHDELGDLAENVNRMSRKLSRLYEDLETASRHKSTFLANMSHELRTPMNAIIGFNRLVMRRCKDILPEKQYENLGKIALSAEHLLALINTVLDLSKIEAGRVEVRPNEFALAPLLELCVRTMEPLVDEKDVVFEQKIEPVLPVMNTDQAMLRQIVLNLLSNAAKFTERGRITLAAGRSDDEVAISVSDTGIGISAEHLPRIFEEFTQVDDSTTRRHTGTGLGLAISQRLAGLLGGRIEVRSDPGTGSTFTLRVPVVHREPDDEATSEGYTPAEERVA